MAKDEGTKTGIAGKFGTLGGVFTPNVLTILGVIMFLRTGWVVGNAGLKHETYHGDMLPFANRWLKWAFIEASWVAIGCSSYFGEIYRRHLARGKQAHKHCLTIGTR